jgi:RNA polymerase sigma-70 factor (ECF subfamily)
MTVALATQARPPLALTDPAAFEAVYQRCHREVFRYTLALCGGDAAEAEDVTAETFLRAWRSRSRFVGGEGQALGWLLTIARNILIDKRRLDRGSPGIEPLDAEISAAALDMDELLIHQEELELVLGLLQQLPLAQREIVILRYMLDWRVKAIAQHLNISENAASVALHRAIKHVRSALSAGQGGSR